MPPPTPDTATLIQIILRAAREVHRDQGPGLTGPIYEWCLSRELGLRGLAAVNPTSSRITYKGFVREEFLRTALLVEDRVLVEVMAVDSVLPVHTARLPGRMKLLKAAAGILINFNTTRLADGASRFILSEAGG
jgi:GxxExxY protein